MGSAAPVKTQTSSTLQPEIWSLIFAHLRRPPLPPFKSAVEWEDLHQQDLTSVSRVSSIFHEAAIPHLYTSVCINALPSFLHHLDDAPPSLASKITSKRVRIASIKHFRIAALGAPCLALWKPSQLLEGSVRWQDVGELEKGIFRKFDHATEELTQLVTCLDSIRRGELPISMPLLDTVIIGHVGRCCWKQLFDSILPLPVGAEAEKTRKVFTKFLFKLNPRVICIHSSWTPYSPRYHRGSLPSKLTTICTHHQSGRFGDSPVTFFPGKLNRHYFEPRANGFVAGSNREPGIGHLYDCARALGANRQLLAQQTIIEMLGYFTPASAISPVYEDLVEIFGKRQDGDTSHDEVAWEKGTVMELDTIGKMSENVARNLGASWKNRLYARAWSDIPPCEACGWTIKDISKDKTRHVE